MNGKHQTKMLSGDAEWLPNEKTLLYFLSALSRREARFIINHPRINFRIVILSLSYYIFRPIRLQFFFLNGRH